MNSAKRLLRKPLPPILWILLVAVMTGFFAVGSSLFFSTNKLSKTLDSSHTAIAVRIEPEVHSSYDENLGEVFTFGDGTFTLEDKAVIEAIPAVKEVRSHTLTGGMSPSFNPIIDIQRVLGWRADGQLTPYWNTVITGRVHRADTMDYYNCIGVDIEEFYIVNRELDEAVLAVEATGGLVVVFESEYADFPEWKNCFQEGERYIFSGQFAPEWMMDNIGWIEGHEHSVLHMIYWPWCVKMHDGVLMSVNDAVMTDENGVAIPLANDGKYPLWSFPLYAKLEGDMSAEEFFNTTEEEVWRDYRAALELQQHSLPVIGTDKLETTYAFLTEKARITEGRTFTEEEYEQGAKVMIVSDRMAKLGGVSIGDTVKMRQYDCVNDELGTLGYYASDPMNNPTISYLDMNMEYGPEEEFTVVGIYHLVNDWTYTSFSFTPNTVFIPRSAQIEGGFGEIKSEAESKMNIGGYDFDRNLYGVYLSIEINNGMVDDFRKSIEETRFAGEFFAFDQGFETVQKSFNGLSVSARRILILSIIGWLLFLPLFLILFQGRQRSNVGIMRSLGSKPYKQTVYLFISGMIVVIIGIAIGTLLSTKVLDLMQAKILKDAFEGLDQSASPESLEIAQKSLEDMVAGSALPMKTLVLIGLMQVAAFTVPVIIHAIALAHTPPRKLKG